MVGRLHAHFEDFRAAAAVARALAQHLLEQRHGHVVGAGAGHQKPARLHQLHRGQVDVLVAAVGARHFRRALAEGGRVEDDAPELFARRAQGAQVLEGVRAHRADVRKPVPRRVRVHALEGERRDIHRRHLPRDGRRVQRESAAVAEAV